MKRCARIPILLSALLFVLCIVVSGRLTAQTFTTLHSFSQIPCQPCLFNFDGAYPYAGLVVSENTLFGTTFQAGPSGYGTVFSVRTDGTGFTILKSFSGNADGGFLYAGLLLLSNTLYGTTHNSGYATYGTVFAVNTDGTGFFLLHSFTNSGDGAKPFFAALVSSSNTLYGTTTGTGSATGTVFAVNVDGTGFKTLYTFTGGSDGGGPAGGLILSGQTLYGTTYRGGISSNGTVYAVNSDGTGFTVLHDFVDTNGTGPVSTLVLSGKTLYGTTPAGGAFGFGAVFALKTDGTGFSTLHNFSGVDGSSPQGPLFLSGNTLFGTTYSGGGSGGSSGGGTVFAVDTDGTGFTTLHRFSGGDGANSFSGVVLSGNSLYGTTRFGGASGNGTVFRISLPVTPPQLEINSSEENVVLRWPTNSLGFTLQSTTNMPSPVWATNSPAPVVVNGQNTVTNPISGTQRFFRLAQ